MPPVPTKFQILGEGDRVGSQEGGVKNVQKSVLIIYGCRMPIAPLGELFH